METVLSRVGVGFPAARIDWERLARQRQAFLDNNTTLPAYLLLPEIRGILDITPHANHHLLVSTLWHTGARISEALALTPKSFVLDGENSFVMLKTLKQRGRPRGGVIRPEGRIVPIRDSVYLQEIVRYLATHKPKPGERLFNVTRQAIDKRLRQVAQAYQERFKHALSIAPSAHTFRHSFAVNAVLHGVPLTVLQTWLGHKHLETTAIYAQVLAVETGHLMAWVEY